MADDTTTPAPTPTPETTPDDIFAQARAAKQKQQPTTSTPPTPTATSAPVTAPAPATPAPVPAPGPDIFAVARAANGVKSPPPTPESPSGILSTAEHMGLFLGQEVVKGAINSYALAPYAANQVFENWIKPRLPESMTPKTDARFAEQPFSWSLMPGWGNLSRMLVPTETTDEIGKVPAQAHATTPEEAEQMETSLGLNRFKSTGPGADLLAGGARGAGAALATLPFGGLAAPRAVVAAGTTSGLVSEKLAQMGAPGWLQTVAALAPAFIFGSVSAASAAAKFTKATIQAVKDATDVLNEANQAVINAKQGPLAVAAEQAKANALTAKTAKEVSGEASQGMTDPEYLAAKAVKDAKKQQAVAQEQADKAHEAAVAASESTRDKLIATAKTDATKRQQASDMALSDIADQHGTAMDAEDAGGHMQDKARPWVKSMSDQAEEMFAPVDAKIPDEAPGSLDNIVEAARAINKNAGELQPIAELFHSSLPKTLAARLDHMLTDEGLIRQAPTEDSAARALGLDMPGEPGLEAPSATPDEPPPKPPTYRDMRSLRTVIGDALAKPEVVTKIGAQNLKRLYAAITDDIKNIAEEHDAGAEFTEANTKATAMYDLAEGPVSRITSGVPRADADITPGAAAKALLRTANVDGTELQRLRVAGFPVGELTSAMLRQGSDAVRKWWQRLPTSSKEALVPDQTHRDAIEASLDAHASAPTRAKDQIAVANAQHESTVATLELQRTQARQATAAPVEQAQAAQEATAESERARKALLASEAGVTRRASAAATKAQSDAVKSAQLRADQAQVDLAKAKAAVTPEPDPAAIMIKRLHDAGIFAAAGAMIHMVGSAAGWMGVGAMAPVGRTLARVVGGVGENAALGATAGAVARHGFNALIRGVTTPQGRAAVRAGVGANLFSGAGQAKPAGQ